MKYLKLLLVSCAILFSSVDSIAQKKKEKKKDESPITSALNSFKFRSVGPAFMSGRIADIAIDETNENVWYVAVGSGGVWKTENAGTTWNPIADNMPFYSTGCITIDPSNNSSIWLGTGENVGGRHVGIGHGVYHSSDAGKSWKNMGLKNSEHISKIIVHPNNPNVIWIAAQGPLWSSGGDRGLFKSVDGGKTWENKLEINEWTGVTDLVINPENPNILYLASWQRHRNVAALMDGGPGTALYKSVDAGENWKKINNGLPGSNMGKIGLAISPMQPNILYAAIELDRREGAVYKSVDSGGSWKKMSETVSGGTGPHYYQELVASPHVFDKIYLMNVRVLVSENGGKDFYTMKERKKHSDNHSLTFKADDPNYMLIGTDGGIYESFDNSKSWKFVGNLPLTQFYKLAVDDAEPFYNIYGGTQDNNTQGGPSRTFKNNGISNADWYVVLGGDGHQPATEPGNPDIIYAQSQEGFIHRIDMTNREVVNIRPQEDIDEPYERFNWDAPILVSHHNPKKIYFGSQRVWVSENRGDSWNAISGDLTKNEERFSLPIMGGMQSFDNAWDVYAMSTYNTITSLSESALDENILYVGTDDGIIQHTKDGGKNWTKLTVDKLPGTPKSAFVNDIKADLHDKSTAYVVLDNHKFGDYKPYLFMTEDGGKNWKSITKGLPEGTLLWRIVQDHVNPNLLFLGTEYGVYVSLNKGKSWDKFSAGLPTISVRDLAIQKRENDLVLATFGRSFYVLDDYSALRDFDDELMKKDGYIFKPRKALQYNQIYGGTSSDGGQTYYAKNPAYGANIKFYIKDAPKSLKQKRKKAEKENMDFVGWDALDKEKNEQKNQSILVIKNKNGDIVSKISNPLKKGINNVNWSLSSSIPTTVKSGSKSRYSSGVYTQAKEGKYDLFLYTRINGVVSEVAGPVELEVEKIRSGTLQNPLSDQHDKYYKKLAETFTKVELLEHKIEKASDRVDTYQSVLIGLKNDISKSSKLVFDLVEMKNKLERKIGGSESKKEVGEKDNLTIYDRLWSARGGWYPNSYGPTALHMRSYDIAKKMLDRLEPEISDYLSKVDEVGKILEEAGAPIVLD